jgi:hypothetical protein
MCPTAQYRFHEYIKYNICWYKCNPGILYSKSKRTGCRVRCASKRNVTMATKKQVTATETAAAAVPARAAKPKTATPRVRTVKHSKTVAAESSVPAADTAVPQMEADALIEMVQVQIDHHGEISRIAYGYWESRGYQGGSQVDDWLRAEHEYRQRIEQQ